MCEKCSKYFRTQGITKAQACGHRVTSGGKKWCPGCAKRKGVCESCGDPLKRKK